ncbi:MAG TPA: hypothetical protein VNB29_03015 [Chthoniobacterales bacterium]|nr:hypothetical protein [Chthoniobacterales bacterium]
MRLFEDLDCPIQPLIAVRSMRESISTITAMTEKKSKDPWEKGPPKNSRHTKLTPKSKAKAKARAKKAGRKYPSLVDNMNAAKEQRAHQKKP